MSSSSPLTRCSKATSTSGLDQEAPAADPVPGRTCSLRFALCAVAVFSSILGPFAAWAVRYLSSNLPVANPGASSPTLPPSYPPDNLEDDYYAL